MATASTAPASAQDPALQAHFGEQTYRLFCVGCHGPDGRGNPPVTEALELPAVDLTTIARRHNGTFPHDEVVESIAGIGKTGHARIAMPHWAEVFADEFAAFRSDAVVDEMVRRRIDHLVAYIESLQR